MKTIDSDRYRVISLSVEINGKHPFMNVSTTEVWKRWRLYRSSYEQGWSRQYEADIRRQHDTE